MSVEPNTVFIFLSALLNAGTAYMAWKTKKASEKTELNTNSMREQLVAATDAAAHAKGMSDERANVARAADKAKE
jgi:hypothetical protein